MRVGVSRRATLGAVIHDFGSVVVDGWLRLLGAAHSEVGRSVDVWNQIEGPGRPPLRLKRCLLIGDDAVGGFYAISDGTLADSRPGTICHYSPRVLSWGSLRVGYAAFVSWALNGGFPEWRERYAWPGWREEVEALRFDQTINIYPPLFSKGPGIEERSRRAIPAAEAWDLYVNEFPRQLGLPTHGGGPLNEG